MDKTNKLGRVKVPDPVGWHPIYGNLKHGQILELPDSWDFSKETLCDPVDEKPERKAKKELTE